MKIKILFCSVILAFGILPVLFSADDAASPAKELKLNSPVSVDAVGKVTDFVRFLPAHWSKASGDPNPDIIDDVKDIDDDFGRHEGAVAGIKGFDDKTFDVSANASVSWSFTVPKGGDYVLGIMARCNKGQSVVLEYQKGTEWVAAGKLEGEKDYDKSYQDRKFFFLIRADNAKIKVRARGVSGNTRLFASLIAEIRTDPFDGKPAANAEHPRLLFRKSDLPALKKKILEHPFCSTYMKSKKSLRGESALKSGSYKEVNDDKVDYYSKDLIIPAVFGSITGDEEWIKVAIDLLKVPLEWKNSGLPLRHGGLLSAMAIAYDCLYDRLDPVTRDKVRRHIETETNRLYAYAIVRTGWGGVEPPGSNWRAVINGGIGTAGLALKGESKYADDYIKWGEDLCKAYINTALSVDGSCKESYGSYFNYGVGSAYTFLLMDKNVTGNDLIEYNDGVIRKAVEYSLYLMNPQRDGFCMFGDTGMGYWGAGVTVPAIASHALNDRLAQWIVYYYGGERSGRVGIPGARVFDVIFTLLCYNTTLEPESPDKVLPLARCFDAEDPEQRGRWGMGYAVLKTGFESKDDIAIMIHCGDACGGHGHPDQGSFTMDAYGGHLVADFGLYGKYSGVANEWVHNKSSHNYILIDDKGQADDHHTGSGRNMRDGSIDAFINTPFVDYVLANNSLAYLGGKAGKVDRANRHFIFVRKPNRQGYLILVDDLKKDSTDHKYTWMLHSAFFHEAKVDEAKSEFSITPINKSLSYEIKDARADEAFAKHEGGAWKEGAEAVVRGVIVSREKPKLDVSTFDMENQGWWNSKPAPKEGVPVYFPGRINATVNAVNCNLVTLLYPESEKLKIKMPEVKRITEGSILGIQVGNDFLVFNQGDGRLKFQNLETDGKMLFVSIDGGKNSYFVQKATELLQDGKALFKSDKPIGIAFNGDGIGAADGGKGVEYSIDLYKEAGKETVKGKNRITFGKAK